MDAAGRGLCVRSFCVPDRYGRLLLLLGAALWLLAAAAGRRRDWQDDWILADLLLPYLGFLAVAAVVLLLEPSNSVVAIAASFVTAVLLIIPAVKYVQPYGTAVDAVVHLQTVETLMGEGRLPTSATYAAIPGMHAFLAEAGLLGGLGAGVMVGYVLPLINALMPLFTYLVVHRAGLPARAVRAAVILSCLAAIPGFRPNGSTFATPPLFVVLGAVVLFAYYSRSRGERAAYALVAALGTLQLVVWHSTTPFMLLAALVFASLSPWLVGRVGRSRLLITVEIGAFAAGALLFTFAYHWLANDSVWMALQTALASANETEQGSTAIVPQRMLEIGLLDKIRVACAMHGRDAVLAAAAAGCLVILFHRRQWQAQMPLYAFFLLSLLAFGAAIVFSIGGAGYRRFTLAPVAVAPLFAAPLFWWTPRLPRRLPAGPILLAARVAGAALLAAAWTVQIYLYQPFVPTARSLGADGSNDTLLWLQEVNTRYQKEMLTFVEEYSAGRAIVAADIVSQNQYERYFGPDEVAAHRFYELKWQDQGWFTDDVELILLHRPGRAGSYGEQVELRSGAAIAAWRQREDLDLIYDNGQSFVLSTTGARE